MLNVTPLWLWSLAVSSGTDPHEDFRIVLRPLHRTVSSSKDIELKVVVSNRSGKPRTFYQPSDRATVFAVESPAWWRGHTEKEVFVVDSFFQTLLPRRRVSTTLLLSSLVDTTKPGTRRYNVFYDDAFANGVAPGMGVKELSSLGKVHLGRVDVSLRRGRLRVRVFPAQSDRPLRPALPRTTTPAPPSQANEPPSSPADY
jgi:hypothetical protein